MMTKPQRIQAAEWSLQLSVWSQMWMNASSKIASCLNIQINKALKLSRVTVIFLLSYLLIAFLSNIRSTPEQESKLGHNTWSHTCMAPFANVVICTLGIAVRTCCVCMDTYGNISQEQIFHFKHACTKTRCNSLGESEQEEVCVLEWQNEPWMFVWVSVSNAIVQLANALALRLDMWSNRK